MKRRIEEKNFKKLRVGEIPQTRENSEIIKKMILKPKTQTTQELIDSCDTRIRGFK